MSFYMSRTFSFFVPFHVFFVPFTFAMIAIILNILQPKIIKIIKIKSSDMMLKTSVAAFSTLESQ
jgi:hypothetical protein